MSNLETISISAFFELKGSDYVSLEVFSNADTDFDIGVSRVNCIFIRGDECCTQWSSCYYCVYTRSFSEIIFFVSRLDYSPALS